MIRNILIFLIYHVGNSILHNPRYVEGLDSFEQSGYLSHRGDQMCSNTGSDALALGSIREPI
jgi:hypothetical protein